MTIRNGVLDWAKQRPLGPQTEPPIDPRVLIYHIIVGSASAGYNVFKSQGYTGDESTFIVCGPRDVPVGYKDGEVWQLQNCKRQADAQFAGNEYADSVETSGMPNEPFSSEMLKSLIRLTVDWCREYKKPAQLVPRTGPIGVGGLGWHELRADWNLTYHRCPGVVREGQLRTIVIPKARAILEGALAPKAPTPKPAPAHHDDGKIDVDGVFGAETIGALQHTLAHGGYYILPVDGVFGPGTRKALQKYLRHLGIYSGSIDGIVGDKTVRALQTHIHATVDGDLGPRTIRRLQEALNMGRF
jgi:hypothetical protein